MGNAGLYIINRRVEISLNPHPEILDSQLQLNSTSLKSLVDDSIRLRDARVKGLDILGMRV